MKSLFHVSRIPGLALLTLFLTTVPVPLRGQEENRSLRDAFYRALGEYFQVEEVLRGGLGNYEDLLILRKK